MHAAVLIGRQVSSTTRASICAEARCLIQLGIKPGMVYHLAWRPIPAQSPTRPWYPVQQGRLAHEAWHPPRHSIHTARCEVSSPDAWLRMSSSSISLFDGRRTFSANISKQHPSPIHLPIHLPTHIITVAQHENARTPAPTPTSHARPLAHSLPHAVSKERLTATCRADAPCAVRFCIEIGPPEPGQHGIPPAR